MGRGKAPAPALPMSEIQKSHFIQLSRNHSTAQQIVKRIKILLLSHEGANNSQIKRELQVSYNTVLTWRKRWLSEYESLLLFEKAVAQGTEKHSSLLQRITNFLKDAPRSGAPKKFTLAQRQQIVALCCEDPRDYGLEMTDWTHEMLAKTAIATGIVASISPSHLGKILKKSALTSS